MPAEELEPAVEQPDDQLSRSAAQSHLPSGRKREQRENLGRLAAMAGGRQIDPAASTPSGGKVSFHCPGCARLIWIRPKDAGKVVNCSGCSLEVVCPAPGKEPRLLHPKDARQIRSRTSLPTHRSEDHLPVEVMAKSRDDGHKRTPLPSGPNRPGRTLAGSPSEPAPIDEVRPIPKNRDIEISPTELKRYRAASRERKIQRATAPLEELKTSPKPDTKASGLPPSQRKEGVRRHFPGKKAAATGRTGTPAEDSLGGHRLNPERVPTLDIREDLEPSTGEPADAWGADSAKPARSTHRLLILALVLGVPAMAAAAFFAFRDREDAPIVPTNELKEDNPIDEFEASKALFEKFLAAASIEDRLPLVRHPDETRPRMKIYESQNHLPLPSVVEYRWPESGWLEDKKFTWIDILFNDGNPRTAVFEITPEGPKLDWESFVFFEDPPMSDFVSRQPEEPAVYRVICSIDHYYNRLYEDEEKYLCFHIMGPDEVSSCWAYADVHSDIGWDLSQLFKEQGQKPTDAEGTENKVSIKVMLKLRFEKDEKGESNSQAWIDEIVSESWVIP